MKRNVLASFTSVLLLPVTIVPRTVGAVGGALMTGGTAAVQGLAMLNPARWGGVAGPNGQGGGGVSKGGWGVGAGAGSYKNPGAGEKTGLEPEKDENVMFEVGQEDDDEDDEKDWGVKKTQGEEDPWAARDGRPEAAAATKGVFGSFLSNSSSHCGLPLQHPTLHPHPRLA